MILNFILWYFGSGVIFNLYTIIIGKFQELANDAMNEVSDLKKRALGGYDNTLRLTMIIISVLHILFWPKYLIKLIIKQFKDMRRH